MFQFACCLFVFVALSISEAVNPGFRTEITQKGLDYIREIGLPRLINEVQSFDIPDQSGENDGFKWKLSDIKSSSLVIPKSSLTVAPGKGLKLLGSGASMKVTAAWSYELEIWPHFPYGSGTCDIPVSNTEMGVTIAVGADSSGRPTVKALDCTFDIGSIDIHFHGSDFDWLYNLFNSQIAGFIKSSIRSKVCPLAVNAINEEGNKALETLPVVEKVSSSAEINFELIQAPIFNSTYLQTLHKGEFLYVPHPIETPFQPPPLPLPSATNFMSTLWLTNYIANTAGYVFWEAGTLQINVTPDMVPKDIPFPLNTSTFKNMVPALYAKYPNKAMQLFINATSAPAITGTPKGLNLTATGDVAVSVILDNKTVAPAFTVRVTMYAKADVWLHQNGTKEVLSGNATYLFANISLVHSDMGPFDVSKLNESVNALIGFGVVPLLNVYGKTGITIPAIEGVSFKNATLRLGDNFVAIDTDFAYDTSVLDRNVSKGGKVVEDEDDVFVHIGDPKADFVNSLK
ncbi:bactericidal permeability-increasing protein-like [Corticium candelabrum]|uniref:bactericidal permeability-increasing protein-like n=1 Tax=Corticium candelabrum TaxID=121492 RepID=UPI002E272241|nr:bactericidal permeability-increasing protein-like [Corticium candelabrum]